MASLKYTKQTKDSNLYDLRYKYVTMENELYCQYCGRTWHTSEGEVYESETVVDMIYSMLEDECTVIIEFWDGKTKKYCL